MNQEIIKTISEELNVRVHQIEAVLSLLEEGNTVPFIARYRKEKTGALDEDQIRTIDKYYQYQVNLLKRKEDVIRLIDEKGMLNEKLKTDILKATQLSEVEDLYRPYKEKRKTKAVEIQPKSKAPRIIAGVVAACVCIGLVFVQKSTISNKKYAGQTLHVYNAGEYTGENLISNFEKKTGCKVVMDLFDSNEQMYIKVANGEAYDILIPSDYMIERLKQEKLIQPLDQDKITCLDDINDAVKNLSYDPNNEYSVPYFWGSVGIVYDKTKVSEKDLKEQGFNIFLNQKYKGDIYLYDSERDSFMMALKALGYSMNTDNEKELEEAYNWLLGCVNTMSPEIVTDEIIDNMAQARKAFGLIYSGDAAYAMSENENVGYYMPNKGTNIWCDAMVIPQSSKHVDLAHEFINYVSSYEAAYDNSSYVGYTSSNTEVMNDLQQNDFKGINAYNPIRNNKYDEVFNYNAETRKIMANYWSKVKIAASNANNQ